VKFLSPIALLVMAACAQGEAANKQGNSVMEVDIESDRYADRTRELEDRFKEVVYVDLNGHEIDYSTVTDRHMAEVSRYLRNDHSAEIEAFETAFIADEVKAGATNAEARARAKAYVDDYFQSLWDVQINLNN
jgi:hypothetical protein